MQHSNIVLVTGASGFLGMHLVRRLSRDGVAVRALYRYTAPDAAALALPGVSWVQCDLLDVYAVAEVMEDVLQVYHCAATVSFSSGDSSGLIHNNMTATANLVNEALDRKTVRLLFVSSVATLGRGRIGAPLTEEDHWEESRNNTTYARSKYFAEMEVWRGIAEGLDAVIINPGIILGPGNWAQGSAALMRVADKEFPFYTEGINGWVDVADVVDLMCLLMAAPVTAERYIVSGGNHSYRHIFTEMAAALHRKPPSVGAGKWLCGLLWRLNALYSLFSGKKAVVTRETSRTARLQVSYNNAKLLQQFPSFRYRAVAETIAVMALEYRQSGV